MCSDGGACGLQHAELLYQAERAAKMPRLDPTPDYIFARYRRAKLWRFFPKELVFRSLRGCAGREVLDFGCGEGQLTVQIAKLGGRVTGMDFSPDLIAIAQRRSVLDGVGRRVKFITGDILESPPPPNRFDFVVGNHVLHHVNLRAVVPRFVDGLKPGGAAIIAEPIALSPFAQKVPDSLPIEKDASPDERQLNQEDIQFIQERLADSEVTYFTLLGRLARLLPDADRIDQGHPFTKGALVMLAGADRVLLTLSRYMARYAGVIVIVGKKARG